MLFKGDLDNLADISYLNANLNTSKSCQDGLIRYLCSLYEYSERKTRNLFLGIDDEFTTSLAIYSITGIRSILIKDGLYTLFGSSDMLFHFPHLVNVSIISSSFYPYKFVVDSVGDLGFDNLTYSFLDLFTYLESFPMDEDESPDTLYYSFDFNYLLLSNISFMNTNLLIEFLNKNLKNFNFRYYIHNSTVLELLISLIESSVSLFNFKDYSLELILNNFNVPLKCFKRLNNEFKSSIDSNTIIVKKYLELFEYFLSNNVKFKFSESINNELEFYHLLYSLKC